MPKRRGKKKKTAPSRPASHSSSHQRLLLALLSLLKVGIHAYLSDLCALGLTQTGESSLARRVIFTLKLLPYSLHSSRSTLKQGASTTFYQFPTMGASTFVIIIIFVLDLIAFGLGIGAEQRRAKGSYVTESTTDTQWCQYDSDIATGLSAGALLFLLTGQVVVLAATRCLCCGNSLKPGAARAFAVIFFILNWLSFLVAASCFLAGAVQNAKHIRYFSSILNNDQLTCSAIRKDTFAAGVAFTFFTFILSVSYYLCCTKAQGGSWKNQYNNRDTGVNMASYS